MNTFANIDNLNPKMKTPDEPYYHKTYLDQFRSSSVDIQLWIETQTTELKNPNKHMKKQNWEAFTKTNTVKGYQD